MTRDMFVERLSNETPLAPTFCSSVLAVLVGAGVDPAEGFATAKALANTGVLRPVEPRTYREG